MVRNEHNNISCDFAEYEKPDREGAILCKSPHAELPVCAHAQYCGILGCRILKYEAIKCPGKKVEK